MKLLDSNFIELTKQDIEKKVKLPKFLDSNLCELCGIHVGDGHLGLRKEKGDYFIQWLGHPTQDKKYYDIFIRKLWKKVFNVNLPIRKYLGNVYGFRLYSKGIATFLNKILQLPFGKKAATIRIPEIIKNTSGKTVSKEVISCVRGIIDTDFYFILDKGYPELGGWFASRNLY